MYVLISLRISKRVLPIILRSEWAVFKLHVLNDNIVLMRQSNIIFTEQYSGYNRNAEPRFEFRFCNHRMSDFGATYVADARMQGKKLYYKQ